MNVMTTTLRKATAVWRVLLGFAGALGCLGTAAQAQQFSADLVSTAVPGAPSVPSGKLHVRDGKVRIETPDFPDGFFVIDAANRTARFVRPAARIFMDAAQSSRLARLFVPVDPADPCRQWQSAAALAGVASESGPWRCERLGEARIEGRDAALYRATPLPDHDILAWVDPQLKFPLKIQSEGGSVIAVTNIQEAQQSANLFEIPQGLRKFDPQDLIRRIKQSDVWVDDPAR
jgi:hypothetical protein